MNFIQQMVNRKLNNLETNDLLKLSKEYQIPITTEQAAQVVTLLRGKSINIYDHTQRIELIKQVAKVTSPSTAQQVNTLLQNLLK